MPIRPDLRQHYGREWHAVTRPAILKRAGDKCEQCKAPNHAIVYRNSRPEYRGVWFDLETGAAHNSRGKRERYNAFDIAEDGFRHIKIVLCIAHLNHVSGDDRPENLKALCQWCHLQHDKAHHADTRAARKDQNRPLLQGDPNLCPIPPAKPVSKKECTPPRNGKSTTPTQATAS